MGLSEELMSLHMIGNMVTLPSEILGKLPAHMLAPALPVWMPQDLQRQLLLFYIGKKERKEQAIR